MPTVIALFQSPELAEQAVLELSLNGFSENDVAMVLFSAVRQPGPGKKGLLGWLSRGGFLGDTIDRSDGVSVMDGVSIGAIIFGIIGLTWGEETPLGSITVGTLGLLGGGLIGYLFDRLIPEKRRDEYEMARVDGMIMVQVETPCDERAERARRLLAGSRAKQIAVVPD